MEEMKMKCVKCGSEHDLSKEDHEGLTWSSKHDIAICHPCIRELYNSIPKNEYGICGKVVTPPGLDRRMCDGPDCQLWIQGYDIPEKVNAKLSKTGGCSEKAQAMASLQLAKFTHWKYYKR
jgi:hypothetical protein